MADGEFPREQKGIQLKNAAKFDSLLDLLRRLPPTKVEQNVDALCEICPDYAEELLGSVDQPSRLLKDETNGRDFLGCDYNRDGDSFRRVLSQLPERTQADAGQITVDQRLHPCITTGPGPLASAA